MENETDGDAWHKHPLVKEMQKAKAEREKILKEMEDKLK